MKVLWDINFQCDNMIEAKRPDIIVIDKKAKGNIHQYCCTSWCKCKGESGKVPGLIERLEDCGNSKW